MKVIYKPKGRAGEYAEFACNLYTGCLNGCLYCYVPGVLRIKADTFHQKIEVKKRLIQKLQNDCSSMNKKRLHRKGVLLCFTCDPYVNISNFPEYEHINSITREVIELLNKWNIRYEILTKNGADATKDFELYKKGDKFASTLTFLDPLKSIKKEPFARLPVERIHSLRIAKLKYGISTWVSLEPVIEPQETLKLIDRTYKFVDLYKVGKLNYEVTGGVNWQEFIKKAIAKFEQYKKDYYIKDSLKKYMGGIEK